MSEIVVEDSQCRDHDSDTQGGDERQQDQKRQEDNRPARLDAIIQ